MKFCLSVILNTLFVIYKIKLKKKCPDSVSIAKTRSISLPVDLEALVNMMLSNCSMNALARANLNYKSSARSTRPTGSNNPWDYKNINEKLQVCIQLYKTSNIIILLGVGYFKKIVVADFVL